MTTGSLTTACTALPGRCESVSSPPWLSIRFLAASQSSANKWSMVDGTSRRSGTVIHSRFISTWIVGRSVEKERSTVNIAARAFGDDMQNLIAHLRATGQLTAGLILRALLSGNLDLFGAALAELSGLPYGRVSALLNDRGGNGLSALLRRAGLLAQQGTNPFRILVDLARVLGHGEERLRAQARKNLAQALAGKLDPPQG